MVLWAVPIVLVETPVRDIPLSVALRVSMVTLEAMVPFGTGPVPLNIDPSRSRMQMIESLDTSPKSL